MIGILFATRFEARPFLALIRAEQTSNHPFKAYAARQLPAVTVIISGIGKVASALACQVLIRDHGADYILNAGACGALRDGSELAIGQMVRIASAVEGDHALFERPLAPLASAGRIAADLPGATLVTTDKPVFSPEAMASLAPMGDVVDMEGAALARTATLYGVAWDMVKGVSDACMAMNHDQLRRNIAHVSEKLARLLFEEIR